MAYVLSGSALQIGSAAVLSVGRCAIALLLGEPLDPVKSFGDAIALAGVVIATLASPAVEPSPPGSGLPEPAELAAHDPSRETQTGTGTSAEEGTPG
ncbi:hypothetical protein ASD65_08230 [Microbacterium sp. Root61]|uniref:hypothetical protein n=1 Tax=Microbacterium sp. Root61 TaxID=1736570 RepID=UPI0006FCD130|nr:hypothetical protein [Microbacterium sp. Root61]KRA24410.1 hypothetical protein ASD65_08230 [Microbacterium sp. Root61]